MDEPLGPTVAERFADTSEGKRTRFALQIKRLGIRIPHDGPLRYHLLHRTVSAIIEAERFRAEQAMALVHSFSPTHAWFDGVAACVSLWGVEAKLNQLHPARLASGRGLHLACVHGEEEYLSR